jgi:putative two-component system response regulator
MPKLLVVDDNATNLILFRHLLQKLEGAELKCFSDSVAALEWCAGNETDLILLDYMMPVMDGLEFIRRLRRLPDRTDVPVVMVTADTESDVRHQALELGAQDFLTKPVDKTELIARVRNLLALRKSMQQLANRAAWLGEEVTKATAEIAAREKEAILRLSRAAEYRDPETGTHLLRMSNYARLVADQLGLPRAEQELLLDAAPMHDIGKVATPDHILLKPGKLTAEEFDVMKQHATIGYEILRDSVSPLLQCAAVLALAHHEKFDGSGYPQGLCGTSIPLYGRIVAVADVFDALTSERPYKSAWSVEQAVEFLKAGAGSHFDPACVDALLAAWPQVLEIRSRYQDGAGQVEALAARS